MKEKKSHMKEKDSMSCKSAKMSKGMEHKKEMKKDMKKRK